MNKNKPELICPAGDQNALVTAVDSGADAVYFGVKGLNMRASATNFDRLQLNKIMDFLKSKNKKGYLTLNTIVKENELSKAEDILKKAFKAGVDAVILWDMSILKMAKELGLKFHISTQASISNFESLKVYAGLGAERAVLARELSLNEIKNITKKIEKELLPIEIETFIHGAMCLSVSGRCFLSSYSWGKSANRGECRQSCRREYDIIDSSGEAEYRIGKDYILSPKDLNTIFFIDDLLESGIHAFKIEGRMRSAEYIKEVVTVYREAIERHFDHSLTSSVKEKLNLRLKGVYNRGFSNGFYFGKPESWISRNPGTEMEKVFIGEVTNFYKKIGVAEILVRSNKLKKGEKLFIYGKNTPSSFAFANEMEQDHKIVDVADKGEKVALKLPFRVRKKDMVFAWRERKV